MSNLIELIKAQGNMILNTDISSVQILTACLMCLIFSIYIYYVYSYTYINNFSDPDFGVSMTMISIVVAAIVSAAKSDFAITLSAVGALSIIRFRTAVKNPMDLMFMFWSIGIGVICGTGVYNVAFYASVVITIGILVMRILPKRTISNYLLTINVYDLSKEKDIINLLNKYSKSIKLDTKNITGNKHLNLVFEVKTKEIDTLVEELTNSNLIDNISVIHQNGDYNL